MTIDEYRDYRKGYTTNYLNIGIGGVADSFPIADAELYMLNVIAPTPFSQATVYELLAMIDLSIIVVPFGTRSEVSYTDLESRPGDTDYREIVSTYVGVVAIYKMPLGFR